MITNVKLALKVLREMNEDFIHVEASLANIPDEARKIELFKEIREHRLAVEKLKTYYQKILVRQS